jgi:ferredoxin-NADP reductase/Na+-translocating ferredoxin:NAD+ oxidoreductase RnfD subunit
MYRLLLYTLLIFVGAAVIFCFFGWLPFKPWDLAISALVLIVVCLISNKILGKLFKVPINAESDYITALILSLIITPPTVLSGSYFQGLEFLIFAGVVSQASKYILSYKGKHFFNPAAFAVVLAAFTISQSASWWVGTLSMLPLIIIGGLLIVRKIQRFDLVLSFLLVAIASITIFSPSRSEFFLISEKILIDSPILFFSFIMLTEPFTTPPTRKWRILYGVLIGLIFGPSVHLGSIYSTPELALILGNIFSYILSPKVKHLLTFKSKREIGRNTFDFTFESKDSFSFKPGQYLEFTIANQKSDTRGNRRYFTIASSPTEETLHLGIKYYENPSTFKKTLSNLNSGEKILAGNLAGDFVLPKSQAQKLAFIAGGIGITPFRSMIKNLIDREEKRDIVLFYSNKSQAEIAYKEIFDQALSFGVRTVYINTDESGPLTKEKIAQETSDFKDRKFYLSGPHSMVVAFEKSLKELGVARTHIKTDFFPGYL